MPPFSFQIVFLESLCLSFCMFHLIPAEAVIGTTLCTEVYPEIYFYSHSGSPELGIWGTGWGKTYFCAG